MDADFWVNQFDADGLATASERIKHSSRLKNGQLTYLDHGSLGLLIKVTPQQGALRTIKNRRLGGFLLGKYPGNA